MEVSRHSFLLQRPGGRWGERGRRNVPGARQDATGQSQQSYLLPVTCSHHCLPALVLVPMPGVMAKSWLTAPPFLGGDPASRHKGHLVGHESLLQLPF